MKAKIYTDGLIKVGGFKKPRFMRNFWVLKTIELPGLAVAQLEVYGFCEVAENDKEPMITYFKEIQKGNLY